MDQPKFDGVVVRLGGAEYTVPPLTLRQVRKLEGKFGALGSAVRGGGLSVETIDAVMDFIYAAFSRNYPDITKDELEDLIDLSTMKPVALAIMGISGLEVDPKKVMAPDRPNGTSSTPSSPAPPAGPGSTSTTT